MKRSLGVVLSVLAALSAPAADVSEGRADCLSQVRAKVREAERREFEGDLTRAVQVLTGLLGDLRASPCEGAAPGALLTRLGHVFQLQGKFVDAEETYSRALELRKAAGGEMSADVASSLSDIATALVPQGRTGEAGEILRRAVEILDQVLGPEHADTLVVRNNLGVLLLMTGQHARAEPVLRAVAAGLEIVKPRPVRLLMLCYQNLAAAHFGQRELSKAEHYTRLHLELAETSGSASSIAGALSNLVAVRVEQKKFADAELLLPRAFEMVSATTTSGLELAIFLNDRAAVRRAQKRTAEAVADLREAVELLERLQEYRGPLLADALGGLAAALRDQNQKSEAKAIERRLKALIAEYGEAGWTGTAKRGLGFRIAGAELAQ